MSNVSGLANNKYRTFWHRFFATIIDSILLIFVLEMIVLLPFGNGKSSFAILQIINSLVVLLYFVVSHGRYGFTIGKKIMGIKVITLDEKKLIGYSKAFYRESVWFLTNMVLIVFLIINNSNSDTININVLRISFYTTIIWSAIEMVTMLMNEKRRAIHDFIAGSVIIKNNVK